MLGQTCWLIMLTQSWPSFNKKVGGRSYWLLFGLNVAAGVSSRAVLYNFFQSLTKGLLRHSDICLLHSPRNQGHIFGANGHDLWGSG